MSRHVAFLRAINVGGHTVKMTELRAHFEALGFAQVETFLASGNVVFETKRRAAATVFAREIEARLEADLGYAVATFIRSDGEVAEILRHPAFEASAVAKAGAFSVGILEQALPAPSVKKLMSLATPIDDFHVHGREIYWLCRKKQSESKITNAVLERALGVRFTFRGMSTMQRLSAKYPPT